MKTSNIILNAIGKDEKILKKFTLSELYLKITFVISLLGIIFIFVVIFAFLYFFQSFDDFYEQSVNGTFEFGMQSVSVDQDIGEDLFSKEESSAEISFYLIFMLLLLLFIAILPVLLFYHFYYLKISNEYIFTNQRILIKKGWIANKVTTIHYGRITDASVNQSILDRILGIGSLSVSTAGSDGYKIILNHLENPHALKKALYEVKEDTKTIKKIDFEEM